MRAVRGSTKPSAAKKRPPEGGLRTVLMEVSHEAKRCRCVLPTVGHEAHAEEAKNHHSPSGRLGDRRLNAHSEAVPIFENRVSPRDRLKCPVEHNRAVAL